MKEDKCKICRQLGAKLFLKGERCFSQKCAMVKRAYAPGPKKKRRSKGLSEYGKEQKEKQKLKRWYNLDERQFSRYVKEVLKGHKKTEDAETALIKILESRLDNVVFRLGFASSRPQARQMVSHGHFLVNERRTNIPGYFLKKDDKVRVLPSFLKKAVFSNLATDLKKRQPPSWLSIDINQLEAKVVASPSLEEAAPPVDISLVFGFYSK